MPDEGNENLSLGNLADVYWRQGRYPLARATAQRIYARLLATHDTKHLPSTRLTLARVHNQLGQPDSALQDK